MKRTAIACAIWAGSAACVAEADPPGLPTGDWNFSALLDGKPIGRHDFKVSGVGDERTVVSRADFRVKFLGFTAYRYHHEDTEQWRGACLSTLDARTDDNGKDSQVHAAPDGAQCVMSFAYWDPAIRTQTRLLNAQTGELEAVRVERIGEGSVRVHGDPVQASEFRIIGPSESVVVWYAADGRWVGLDANVAGGRKLSYRLQ